AWNRFHSVAVSNWISGDSPLCADVGYCRLLFAPRADLYAHALPADAGCRVRRQRDLSDDQSNQGQLFGGADHDGMRLSGLSDSETLRTGAAASVGVVGAGGIVDWPIRQFPPAQFVSGGRLLPVSCRRVP